MKSINSALKRQKWETIGSILLLAVFVVPTLAFAGGRKDIYVDGSKSGAEDGSLKHPYHTISEALEHAGKKTDVHIAGGTYKDNIEIPEGVRVYGEDKYDVVIVAKKKTKVVVSMQDNTRIDGVTIEGGRSGIWVDEKAEASISDCIIQDNHGDGIKIGWGKVKESTAVSITKCKIEDNENSGIYAGKRRLVIMKNEIINNDKDGIDIAAGSSAWIEKNEIKKNDKSGMKLNLDGSDIWTKSNSIWGNQGEGVEINAYGAAGRIDINKNNVWNNGRYGVARDARARFSGSIWNGLTIQASTTFSGNASGDVSRIITIL